NDFFKIIEYAHQWISLYQQQPIMLEKDPILYMRGLNYLLNASWYCRDHRQYSYAYHSLSYFRDTYQKKWGKNAEVLAFVYDSHAQLNRIFWEGNIGQGLSIAPSLLAKLKEYENYLDAHKVLIFHYKLAWLYFCSSQQEEALVHLNTITNHKAAQLRDELLIYTNLLALMTHYDLKNYAVLEYKILSTERLLKKAKRTDALQHFILQLIKKLVQHRNSELLPLLKDMLTEVQQLKKDPYLRRSFHYLDLVVWLQHQLSSKPIEQLLKEQFAAS
ncbi:MAG: hypothetical protein AAFO82_04660, partial [Bacteroidota bacterium]